MADRLKNTEAFIKRYGKQVEDEIKTRLLGYDKKASGKLYKSIKFQYRESVKQLEASWRMEDYGIYVDKGVKPQPQYLNGKGTGKSKFIQALKKWCRIKGIDENAAYPIRRNIWKFGIKPTNFFTIPTTRRQKYFEKELEKNIALDIDNQIQKELR